MTDINNVEEKTTLENINTVTTKKRGRKVNNSTSETNLTDINGVTEIKEDTTPVTTEVKVKKETKVTEKPSKSGCVEFTHPVRLYKYSISDRPIGTISGTYYIWNPDAVDNKLRVTDDPNGIGDISCLAGWVDIRDFS